MRAFVGIALDDAARAALGPTLDALRTELPDARLSDPRDLHVTLQFLGEIDAPALTRVATALAAMAPPGAGAATISGLDTFPADGPPKTLFARIVDDDSHCTSLAHHVGLALTPLGLAPEARPFVPHVTLARLGSTASALHDRVPSPQVPLSIRSLTLFESRGGPPPRYHALVTFPLAATPPSHLGPPLTGTHVSPGRSRASGEP